MLDQLASLVPRHLLRESGEVFYAGREAFAARRDLYVLGFNPGGHPDAAKRSVEQRISAVAAAAEPWSAYLDEGWRGRPAGSRPLQKRVAYLLETLKANPRRTPASNLIFVRSARAGQLADARALEDACWPFHQAVIDGLKPRAIVCLGAETGRRVRARLGTDDQIGAFSESNQRGWKSHAHKARSGLIVLSLAHPGVANWLAPASDPSKMVRTALGLT